MSLATLRLREADSTRAPLCGRRAWLGAGLVWFSQPTMLNARRPRGSAASSHGCCERDAPTARALRITVPIWAVACVASAAVAFRLVAPATRALHGAVLAAARRLPAVADRKAGGSALAVGPLPSCSSATTGCWRTRGPRLYAALAIAGLVVLWRRNRAGALVLLGPLTVAVLAAVAGFYPFHSRVGALHAAGHDPRGRRGRGMGPASVSPGEPRARRRGHARALRGAGVGVRPPAAALLRRGSQDRAGVPARSSPARRRRVRLPLRGGGRRTLRRRVRPLAGRLRLRAAARPRIAALFLRDVDRYRGRPRVWLIAGAVPPFQPLRSDVEGYLSAIGIRKDGLAVDSAKPIYPVSATLFDLSDPDRLAAASAETFPIQMKPAAGDPRPNVVVRCGDWFRPLGK